MRILRNALLAICGWCSLTGLVSAQVIVEQTHIDPIAEGRSIDSMIGRLIDHRVTMPRNAMTRRQLIESWLTEAQISFNWQLPSDSEQTSALEQAYQSELRERRLFEALDMVLEGTGICWVARQQQIVLQSSDECDDRPTLVSRLYPLAVPGEPANHFHRAFGNWESALLGSDLCSVPSRQQTEFGNSLTRTPANVLSPVSIEIPVRPRGWNDFLPQFLANQCDAEWLDRDGIGGSIALYGPYLYVRSSLQTHREIETLLEVVQEQVWKQTESYGLSLTAEPLSDFELMRRWQRALLEPISLKVEQQLWTNVFRDFATARKLPLQIDELALQEAGIDMNTPVTFELQQKSLLAELEPWFNQQNLVFIFENQRLFVTIGNCTERLVTTIYPTEDLALARQPLLLASLLMEATNGEWECRDGVGGNIELMTPAVLIVRQVRAVHREIAQLLDALRAENVAGDLPTPEKLTVVKYVIDEPTWLLDLIRVLPQFVAPETWTTTEDGPRIEPLGPAILVRQTPLVQRQIQEFLRDVGAINQSQPSTLGPVKPQSDVGKK